MVRWARRGRPGVGPLDVLKEPRRAVEGDTAVKFLDAVLAQPRVKRLLSGAHLSVDGTLIEAWASMKSFEPKGAPVGDDEIGGGRNATVDFTG